jgi:hypothetical protein
MAEDLCEENIVGLVFGFELVATDGAVGGAEVALVSRVGRGSRRRRKRWPVVMLTASEGREAFEIPESVEGLNKFLGVGEDGDWVRLETGTGSLAGFPVGRRRGERDRGVFLEGG